MTTPVPPRRQLCRKSILLCCLMLIRSRKREEGIDAVCIPTVRLPSVSRYKRGTRRTHPLASKVTVT
jgi:hypothetical protein